MSDWKNFLIKYSEKTKKAETSLCDERGNQLIGLWELKFKTLNVTLLQDLPPSGSLEDSTAAVLCCNLLTSVEKSNEDGVVKRIYSPIQIVQLHGSKGHMETFDLNPTNVYTIEDFSSVSAWLQTLEKTPIAIKLNVLCSYKCKV